MTQNLLATTLPLNQHQKAPIRLNTTLLLRSATKGENLSNTLHPLSQRQMAGNLSTITLPLKSATNLSTTTLLLKVND